MAEPRTFSGRVEGTASGGVTIPLDFDPAEAWGRRDRYHVAGTIDGLTFRGALVERGGAWRIALGPRSGRAGLLGDGDTVEVTIRVEGPQAGELAADIVAALDARPRARAGFEALATFYRKGWLRWIDGTRRRPEVRAQRIAEMVDLIEAGHKERP
ncbi:MAG TPA: YdeI/OmpD-associated family protein [Candidatus Dormibacteraeota bacterium]|jgi:hypothetical protein|nr:YdeI/OmpD-associated family protein [Candidatus Dormibacteraeota bacterium]